MSDLKTFEHGEEGTHITCDLRLEDEGRDAKCCVCYPHTECDL